MEIMSAPQLKFDLNAHTHDDCAAVPVRVCASMITITYISVLPIEFAIDPNIDMLKPYLLFALVALSTDLD